MKKFLTFFALACLTVVGAWAQQITDLADITAGKQVYIKRNNGAYYINIASPSATTATLEDTPSLITLEDAGDGSFYFYNEATRLYVGKTGTDATTAPATSSTTDAGKFTFHKTYNRSATQSYTAPDGLFFIHVENGNRGGGYEDCLNNNGGAPHSIMTWLISANDYCYWSVTVPEMIDVVVNGAPSGTEVSILGETYTDGGKIPAGTTITASDVTPADITGYKHFISIVGNSVIVNYVADPNLTDLYVNSVGAKASTMTPGQWYILTQTRDYESPAMDNGLGNVISRSTTKLSDLDLPVNTPAADIAQYLVRFVASGVGNTYNIQFGTGRFFANQDNKAPANGVSAVSSETNAYNFLVATAGTSGFDLGATNDGTTRSGFGMDNSNTTSNPPHYLNFWSSNAGGGNNTWYLYPVELGEYLNTTTVTYNYYYNGTLKTTKTSTQEIGATVAAPASIHIFTANEYDESAVVSADLVVDVTVKDATPFVAAESYDKIEHWYAMQIRENNWLYNTGTSPVTGTSTYEISAKYAWGFVGNIYDGYVIYNKEAGDAVALDSNTPCTISAAGTSVIWSIPRVGTLGDASFGLKTEGQDPINWQSNQLKRWSGFDLGSSFRVEEVGMGIDGALKAAIAANKTILTNAANLPALYSTADIAAANSSIEALTYNATSQASIDEATATLAGIMDTFYKTAEGKKVALVSKNDWSTRGATLYLTLAKNPTANMTAAAEKTVYSVFTLTYSTENKAYAIQTVYTPNSYVGAPSGNSSPIPASATPAYFTITPQAGKENAIVKPITATQGLHVDGSKNVVGWDANSGASQWAFEAVSDEAYNALVPNEVTYTVDIVGATDGKLIYDSEEYADGDTFKATNLAATDLSALAVEGYYPATINVTDATVTVTYNAIPFQYADSFANIEHWYALNLHCNNKHYAYYNSGATPNVQANVTTYQTADEYAWGFVGNLTDGFVIYNKAAGESMALYSANNDTEVCLAATGSTFKATLTGWTTAQTDGGFCLNVEGQQYINFQGNLLKHWSNNDAGSTFHVVEVYIGEHTYTVNITGGAPEGTKVTINGNEYGNGETVTLDAATATISTPSVDLYNAVVAYNGLNININYVACGIKAMTEIVQGQAYTITSGGTRGAFVINNEKLSSTYKAGVTASDADAYQQFLFVQYDSKYYLYSVGADKFISLAEDGNSTVLTDEPVETDIQFLASEHSCKGTNPVVLQMDEHHLGVSNGYNPAVITTWKSTNDEGNSLRIWPVEATIDMDAILAKFTPAPTGVEITIGATGYATMAYNETIVNKPEGLKAYYCINEGEAGHLTPVEWEKDYIPGYCAYILEGTPNTTYTVDCVDTDTFEYPDTDYDAMYDIYMNNVLIGNFDDTDMDVEDAKATYGNHIYVFSKVDDKMGFYTYVGTTLAAHKAFFATEDVSVNGFILDFEGTEGINSVISATNLKAGYDIQGRRINKVQKGINILNGKKVIK